MLLIFVLRSDRVTVSCQLMGRNPHDHVCGTLTFKPTVIPSDGEYIDLLYFDVVLVRSDRHLAVMVVVILYTIIERLSDVFESFDFIP